MFIDYDFTDADSPDRTHICRGDASVELPSLSRRSLEDTYELIVPLWDREGETESGELFVLTTVTRRSWQSE